MLQRRYPTVSVREGYREWLPSYGATVQDEMDLVLLAALESVRWAAVERTADLGYETGHRIVDMAFANGSGAEALACLRDVAGRPRGAGRIDEYLRVAERLLAEEPHNIEPARDIARGYIVRGNGRYALARLKMCFDKEPRTPRPSICWPRHSSFAVRTTRRRPCWSRSAASTAIRAAPRSRRTPFTARAEAQRLLDEVSGKQRRIFSIERSIERLTPGGADDRARDAGGGARPQQVGVGHRNARAAAQVLSRRFVV